MNRAQFLSMFEDRTEYQKNLVELAYTLAKDAHRSQSRRDGERYFEHPRRVATILVEAGVNDLDVVCAALLHDVVEDTKYITVTKIDQWLGTRVANIVLLVTKQPGYDKAAYYQGISGSWEATAVKLADRLDNLRSMSSLPKTFKRKQVDETRDFITPMASACLNTTGTLIKPKEVEMLVRGLMVDVVCAMGTVEKDLF